MQEKFEFNDCWIYVELTEELVNLWTNTIVSNIDEINAKQKNIMKQIMINYFGIMKNQLNLNHIITQIYVVIQLIYYYLTSNI